MVIYRIYYLQQEIVYSYYPYIDYEDYEDNDDIRYEQNIDITVKYVSSYRKYLDFCHRKEKEEDDTEYFCEKIKVY